MKYQKEHISAQLKIHEFLLNGKLGTGRVFQVPSRKLDVYKTRVIIIPNNETERRKLTSIIMGRCRHRIRKAQRMIKSSQMVRDEISAREDQLDLPQESDDAVGDEVLWLEEKIDWLKNIYGCENPSEADIDYATVRRLRKMRKLRKSRFSWVAESYI